MKSRNDESSLDALLRSGRDSWEPSASFDNAVMRRVHAIPAKPLRRSGPGAAQSLLRRGSGVFNHLRRRALLIPAVAALGLGASLTTWGVFNRPVEEIVPFRAPGPTRIKGAGFDVALLLRKGSGLQPVRKEQALRAGDQVQPLYWLGDSAYILLLSLDTQGKVQCFSCDAISARLPAAQGQPLPYGLELDGSDGDELFVAMRFDSLPDSHSARERLEKLWKSSRDLFQVERALLENAGQGVRCMRIGKEKRP